MRSFFLVLLVSGIACAQAPYYPGTYPDSPAPPPPPPVVYQQAPVYRRAYQAPDWASPNAAALGPWPWNFDFGGGPTPVTGSNGTLTSGSNFTFGGGANFTPQSGFVIEFSNYWFGLSDKALADNGAADGDARLWSVTLNPIWRFRIAGPVGGYITGGGGYYQREERLLFPGQFFVQEAHVYDDAGGVNMGAGLTCNLGWGTKFFVEARYHYIFTPGSATEIIPITFGLRW